MCHLLVCLSAQAYRFSGLNACAATLISIQVYSQYGEPMGRITITLNDELDKKLRQTVSDTIGFKKGNLQVAIEEALEEWIKEHKKK